MSIFKYSSLIFTVLVVINEYCVNSQLVIGNDKNKPAQPALPGAPGVAGGKQPGGSPAGMPGAPSQSSNYYSYLRCWRCDYDDPEQCVKNFDYTKHKHEACDGKCLKAFEKVEARTKIEIDKAQLTPTIRKCVSQKEISSLQSLGINVKNGCHDIRTAKRRHKLYCFCENDLCNSANNRLNFFNKQIYFFPLVMISIYFKTNF